MNNTTCDWCLQKTSVQTIEEQLWRFWRTISDENPVAVSQRNICRRCESRYKELSTNIKKWKTNASIIDNILSDTQVKDEPLIDTIPHLVKEEVLEEDSQLALESTIPSGSSTNFQSESRRTGEVLSSRDIQEEQVENHHLVEEEVSKDSHLALESTIPSGSSTNFQSESRRTGEVLSSRDIQEEQVENHHLVEEEVSKDSHLALESTIPSGSSTNFQSESRRTGEVLSSRDIQEEQVENHHLVEEEVSKDSHLALESTIPSGSSTNFQSESRRTGEVLSSRDIQEEQVENHHLVEEEVSKDSHLALESTIPSGSSTNFQSESRRTEQEVLSSRDIQEEPSIEVENHHLVEEEVSEDSQLALDSTNSQMDCSPASEHTGKKRFPCPYCDKSFSHNSTLSKHKHLHTDLKPYKCSLCNSTFAQARQLKNHNNIHKGEKSFECSRCHKAFAHASTLSKHRHVHSRKLLYKCSRCNNKRFGQANQLKNHQYIHTGKKLFKCPHCNKVFAHSSTLSKHKRTHSND